jgi:DNA-3-methyladenine glycosylase
MRKILPKAFFARPALAVAPELLGKYLVRREGGAETAYCITEVEAYVSGEDLACHARVGETARTKAMFGPPGCWYVYFVYGMHWMLNVTVDRTGHPAAVLIRGTREVQGPGRVGRALGIDKSFYGLPADRASGLWIEDRGERLEAKCIVRTPRIGVAYAGLLWAKKPYRFVLEDLKRSSTSKPVAESRHKKTASRKSSNSHSE